MDEVAQNIVSGAPGKRVLRGITKGESAPSAYSDDVKQWPIGEDGRLVPQVNWGGLTQPLYRANLHFMVAGVPGTGKTLTILSLLRSIFDAGMRTSLGGLDRAVIYDAKLEFYPMLLGYGCREEQVAILNPFDQRGAWWNLAADYTSSSDAHQLARTIIPSPENHQNPFFPKSAAALLAAVVSVHMRKNPGKWDLADVLMGCMNYEATAKVFATDTVNPLVALAVNFLSEPTTRNNVFAELASHVVDFLPVAACWRRSKMEGHQPVSIRKFVDSPDRIVLLGANQTHRVALSAINRLFIRRLSEEMLDHVADGQWDAQNRTWLVLDEVRELGKVEGLADLINKGRSRGVCSVLGFQDYPGMKESFGEHVAHELVATCEHKLFLKLGADSAEWASRMIGKCEFRETNFSRTSSIGVGLSSTKSEGVGLSPGLYGRPRVSTNSGNSESVSVNFTNSMTASSSTRETDAVLPSEIAHLPGFSNAGGLSGFVCKSGTTTAMPEVHKVFIPGEAFIMALPKGPCLGYLARPKDHEDLFESLLLQ